MWGRCSKPLIWACLACGLALPTLSTAAPLPMEAPAVPEGLLLNTDAFRQCYIIQGRWRCLTCRWVRQCGRGGCTWRERCRWGPPLPVIPQ